MYIVNSHLRIAFEFQGPQHYQFLPFFHYTYDDLLDQKRWDKETYNLCKANRIYLIVIPYTLRFDRIQDHIVKEYKRLTCKSLPYLPKFDYKFFLIGKNQIQSSLMDFLNNNRFKLKI
ncbi:MAG: hypothetical protein ACFFBZ_08910 [Promethearchaeota archaeon]